MNPALGEKMRRAREEKNYSLAQAAQSTHIKLHYLEAIEAGDFASLPSTAQGRGFVRAYASYLGLDPQSLLDEMSAEGPADPAAPAGEPAPPAASPPGPSSEMLAASAVFLEIGRKLSAQREVLGLSLQDVERHTHLRNHYLRALEAGDLKGLPSPVQGRGMLANYATFLGLNPEPLLLRFAEGLQGVLVAKQAAVASKPKPARPRPARQGIRMDLLLGAMALVLVVGFVIWGAFRVFSIRAEVNDATRTPSPPPISEVLASGNNPPTTPAATGPAVTLTLPAGAVLPGVEITSTITSTLTTGSITGTASIPGSTQAALPPPPGNSALQVYVVIQQPAWMRVTVDGEVAFEGRVRKGAAFSYEGDSYIDILTGNGAGVQVFFNQVDLGLLGALGEVVDRVFTPQGIFTPTPTITPTPRPVTPTPVGPTATSTQVMIMP